MTSQLSPSRLEEIRHVQPPRIPDRILSAITCTVSDSPAMVQESNCRLSDHRLTDDAIEAYAITISRKGKFVLVGTDASHADRATEILRGFRASRMNR